MSELDRMANKQKELEIYKDALRRIHANAEDNFCAELAIEALNDGKLIYKSN